MTARPKFIRTTAGFASGALVLGLTACSTIGTGDDESASDGDDGRGSGEVVLVAHDSFSLPKKVIREFEETSGYDLSVQTVGDAGTLTNQLILTKDDQPLGDVAFGVDNTFGSRAVEAGVFDPYTPDDLPEGVSDFDLAGDDDHALTPIDNGNVCLNIDTAWFADNDLTPPSTLDDLVEPEYEDLFVTPSAASSSPGLAFLLATIGEYGDDWPDYWQDLLANGAKIGGDWEQAYFTDFSFSGGKRPIVVSYDSSPAFTVDRGETATQALLDTCFLQVEYAGVIEGAENPEGARALIDFMLTPSVQESLPDSMYVYPVADGTELPSDWAEFTQRPDEPIELDPAEIADQREEWLREWSDLIAK